MHSRPVTSAAVVALSVSALSVSAPGAAVAAPSRSRPADKNPVNQKPVNKTPASEKTASAGTAEVAARIRQVEQGLLPLHTLKGQPVIGMDIRERMRHYRAPGLSIAVINNGKVEWARGYGVTQRGGTRPVDVNTPFEAGSIGKAVMAVGALRLVEQGCLGLDEDVNTRLKSWKLSENEFTAKEKVTPRRLMSHSAGLNVHGYGGYGPGEPVPTLVQVLQGVPPSKPLQPLRVEAVPGRHRYSGGGFALLELLMTDVSGHPFADLMNDLVHKPLGMRHSTFAQPLPAPLARIAAAGHQRDGTPLPGKWRTYPEQGAAGYWATPTDLSRLALDVQRSFNGGKGALLSPEMTRRMLTIESVSFGLGFGVGSEGKTRIFTHPGQNDGYVANFVGFAETGQGAVVMANGEGGSELLSEVTRSIARTYGWATLGWAVLQSYEKESFAVESALLEKRAGRYRASVPKALPPVVGDPPGELSAVVSVQDGALWARMPKWPAPRRLYAAAKDGSRFFFADDPAELSFESDAQGRVTAVSFPFISEKVHARRVD